MEIHRDYRSLLYGADSLAVVEILKKWNKKSSSKELKDFTKYVLSIISYVSSLHLERSGYDYVTDRQNTTILKLMQENEDLKKQIDILKGNVEFLEEIKDDTTN